MSHHVRKGSSEAAGTRGVPAHPAGEGVSDDEMARQVTDQTSHDRVATTFFEGERGGARSEEEASKFRDDHRDGSRQPTGV
ncbi:hypothetical protein [Parafrankia sp. FMc2]|uniref:hypothetical protein n=1 Tax=Parafrankia sp. FMc2 TaxID=3233196 RepID=UPI0034D58F45